MADPQSFLIGILSILAAILLVAKLATSHAPDVQDNVRAEGPHILRRPWVLDGDTIDDKASGVRYRLANIDAPETGDNAKCFRERQQGEAAKRAAILAIRKAQIVSARNTHRTDRYGRRVAFVYVDGRDLGELLVESGLAVPWAGSRNRWCGPSGQLAGLAKARSEQFSCKTCKHWR